jgi:hypothetical protein
MKKYKFQYLIVILLILLVNIIDLIFDVLPDDKLNLFIAFVALIIAVISLAISDPKPSKMKLSAKCWSKHNDTVSGKARMVLKLQNNTGISMSNLKVNLRMPSKLYVEMEDTDRYLANSFGQSKVFDFSYTYFLGANESDNECTYELAVNLKEWKKGRIWITVIAEGFEASTYSLSQKLAEVLIEAKEATAIEFKHHE